MANEKLIKVGAGEGEEVQGTYVDLTEGVTIYATDKAPFHKEGSEVFASPYVAEKMVAKGWASKDKPKAK